MGGFSNVMTGLSLVSNLVGGVSSYRDARAHDQRERNALMARQEADYQYAMQRAALDRAQIDQKSQQDDAARQAALKRAAARQRAQFGSSGIASADGSAQAVLLGLFEESDDERRRRDALDTLRHQAITSDLDHRRSVNVLNLSALRDRQAIGSVTGLAQLAAGTTKLLS